MAAVREDFTIRAARDVTLVFVVEADPGQTLDDASVAFQLARHVGSTGPLLYYTIDGGVTVTSDLAFEVEIAAEDTVNFEGLYYYEVKITTGDGNRITTTYGYVTVEASLMGEPSG